MAIVLGLLLCAIISKAYSVLTHEEIVDLVWTDELRTLLLQRFPALREEQIKEAHGYTYGGAVTQDLGYFKYILFQKKRSAGGAMRAPTFNHSWICPFHWDIHS